MSNQKFELSSKKRKAQAFLELDAQNTYDLNYRKRYGHGSYESDPDSSLRSPRTKVREHKRYKGPPPSFELVECGIQAQVGLIDGENRPTIPLFVGDIQKLLLKAVLNSGSLCRPRWCSVQKSEELSSVLLVVVEGLSKDAVLGNLHFFPNVSTIFNNMVEVFTPYRYSSTFAAELCEMWLTFCYEFPNSEIKNWNMLPCNIHKTLSCIVPVTYDQLEERDPDEGFSQLHLLLSPIQMVEENFPLPQDLFECSKTKGYKMTKDVYSPVTSKSPMFAVDCEMCRVSSGSMEATRVAVVDEELQTIYCTLVKPREKITDYVTRFSGVTEKMLRSVTTRLEDVQNKIRELLPPDAILCGQSVNFDLHALKFIHPYIIDTSIIYNTSGCRTRKTSLKTLSSTFLKEKIQNSEKGHCPVEDCIAVMKLIQLKLQNGPQFGDSILSSGVAATKIETSENSSPNSSVQNSKETKSTSFFARFPAEKKNSLIIINDVLNGVYPEKMFNETVTTESVSSNKKAIKRTLQQMSNFNLTLSHLKFSIQNNSDSYAENDKFVGQLYEACSANTMLVFIGTGLKKDNGMCENGFCRVKIKDQPEFYLAK